MKALTLKVNSSTVNCRRTQRLMSLTNQATIGKVIHMKFVGGSFNRDIKLKGKSAKSQLHDLKVLLSKDLNLHFMKCLSPIMPGG